MPGDYRQRLAEAEALLRRARDERERAAFQEIVNTWRRLIDEAAMDGRVDAPAAAWPQAR